MPGKELDQEVAEFAVIVDYEDMGGFRHLRIIKYRPRQLMKNFVTHCYNLSHCNRRLQNLPEAKSFGYITGLLCVPLD